MKDALKRDVILGKEYGYSTNDTVIIGTVRNFTDTAVTLIPTVRRFFIYGNEVDKPWTGTARTISVASFRLFPVDNSKD